MTDTNASFTFSNGSLKISGSELFVSQQLDHFRDSILAALARTSSPLPTLSDQSDSTEQEEVTWDAPEPETSPENQFPRVLDLVNGKLKITKKIPGKNTAERAINTVLVYLWGKANLLAGDLTEAKELRDICKDQSCLDSANFAGTVSGKKDLVIVDGVKGSSSKVYKLTYDGKEKAEQLLQSMNSST